jgi:hypothetical protein
MCLFLIAAHHMQNDQKETQEVVIGLLRMFRTKEIRFTPCTPAASLCSWWAICNWRPQQIPTECRTECLTESWTECIKCSTVYSAPWSVEQIAYAVLNVAPSACQSRKECKLCSLQCPRTELAQVQNRVLYSCYSALHSLRQSLLSAVF